MIALDLFAGTGWGVACQRLGIQEFGVEIMPEARATREANGMHTAYDDVWDGLLSKRVYVNGNQERAARRREDAPAPTIHFGRALNDVKWEEERPRLLTDAERAERERVLGKPIEEWDEYDLLIASPPCQTFSMAGGGAGRKALDEVLGLIDSGAYLRPAELHAFGEKHDPRTALVLTPLSHVARDTPTYVVWEQVPPVLPVWERAAEEMREWGYSVWTGILNAEQYGVPQTRRRAILIARADGKVAAPPTPTHSRYYSRDPKRLDDGVLPWVSMAEALGWGDGDALRSNQTVAGEGRAMRDADQPALTAPRRGHARARRRAPRPPRRRSCADGHGQRERYDARGFPQGHAPRSDGDGRRGGDWGRRSFRPSRSGHH